MRNRVTSLQSYTLKWHRSRNVYNHPSPHTHVMLLHLCELGLTYWLGHLHNTSLPMRNAAWGDQSIPYNTVVYWQCTHVLFIWEESHTLLWTLGRIAKTWWGNRCTSIPLKLYMCSLDVWETEQHNNKQTSDSNSSTVKDMSIQEACEGIMY